jgi:spore coat polysaccharide biosynthesis predicted glycosyltransferase SpsG
MKRMGAKYLTLVSKNEGRAASFHSPGIYTMPFPCARPSFWIRTVAGPSIGFGHLRRSVTLTRMLSDVLHPVFICDPMDQWSQEEAYRQGWGYEPLGSSRLWSNGPTPAGLLIDTREEAGLGPLIREARDRTVPVISIHDLGLNPLPSDVAFDGSIFPVTRDFPRRDTAFYTGTAYLVLDPAFSLLHQQRKRIREKIQSVLVNLGGGESRRYFEKVLEGLQSWGRELEVIGCPGFAHWGQEELARRDWHPISFRWAARSDAVERLLFRADLAITAGGLASFEAMCVGTPLMALSYDGFQHFTVSLLTKAGACLDLGDGNLLKPAAIPPILTSLDENPGQRERLSFHGRQMVDGRGAERVSRVIRRMVGENRVVSRPMVI